MPVTKFSTNVALSIFAADFQFLALPYCALCDKEVQVHWGCFASGFSKRSSFVVLCPTKVVRDLSNVRFERISKDFIILRMTWFSATMKISLLQ